MPPVSQGFLCCDKPVGVSSRDVVNIVQGVVNVGRPRKSRIKVGHTGTLDPLASGVLVIAIGAATRLSSLIGDMSKQYDGTFRLGQSTDSGDLDGDLTVHDLPLPSHQSMLDAAAMHIGMIDQVPPAHSAIHVDGVKAYKRVRAGQKVEMPSRRVRIDSIEVTRFADEEFDIEVRCGGGTYMRTLGCDIAKAAGSIAVMTRLVRTAVGHYRLDRCVDLETLKLGDWAPKVEPLSSAVTSLPKVYLDDRQSKLIDNGCPLSISKLSPTQLTQLDGIGDEPMAAVEADGRLRAILIRRSDQLCCDKVFHT